MAVEQNISVSVLRRRQETYGNIARQFADQVDRIIIRKVPGAANSDERFAAAFDGVPADRILCFDGADELTSI